MDTSLALLLFLFLGSLPDHYKAQDQNPGSLRLINSFGSTSNDRGRLEIYDRVNNAWGTICDDNFGATEARLACNQLGFQSYSRYGNVVSLSYPHASTFTSIWNLECSLGELTISECSRSSALSRCVHDEDVAIECNRPYQNQSSSLRLISKNGATSPYLTAGRVEIFYAGQWGTICSNGFSSSDAFGLCYNLTGSSNVLAYGTTGSLMLPFDQPSSSSPVWVENLQCNYDYYSGRYTYPCNHDGIGITDCTHSKDIAISCRADGAVRLVSSPLTPSTSFGGSNAGRLEIYHNGEWGSVCDDSFSRTDADVVCRQLGYLEAATYGNVVELGYTGGLSVIWLTNVACSSSDVFLANCSHSGFGNTPFCSHKEDVAITCTRGNANSTTSIIVGSVRLISSSYTPSTTSRGDSAGRLEIYYNGQWGTVCDDLFSQRDADVVCSQLGYSLTAYRYGNVGSLGYTRGSSSTPIWLTNVGCSSRDTSLAGCSHSGFGNTDGCSHSEDVAIFCTQDSTGTITAGTVRLISSSFTPSTTSRGGSVGRLEIFYDGQWGTVCDDLFSQIDADVVCRQLDYSQKAYDYGSVGSLSYTRGSSSTPIWLTNVGCTSRDTHLASCSHSGFGNTGQCSHSEDVAIECTDTHGTTRITTTSSISSTAGGLFVFFCYCCICFGFCNSSNRKRRRTTASPPPRTRVVSRTTVPPPQSNATAVVMVAITRETKVDSKPKETAAPPAYPQAQTYHGEAPPDYSVACNYPKAADF